MSPDPKKFEQLSREISACASMLAEQHGLDAIDAAMACGLAGTASLAVLADGDQEKAMKYAQIFAQSGMKAMADIVSGEGTQHQVVQ